MSIKLKHAFFELTQIMLLLGFVLLLEILIFPSFSDAANSSNTDQNTKYVDFPDAHLQQGKRIWIDNCESCHAYGVGDAPIPMEASAWEFRIKKGNTTLYEHAINGFFGPDDAMMPARGGNEKLSDDEVKAAVDYMVALASHYIEKSK